jgi:hemoglobin-like flavoprotein
MHFEKNRAEHYQIMGMQLVKTINQFFSTAT